MATTTAFDPAAETARYLATLPPEVHAKATAYTQGGHWLLLWGTLAAIVVSWLIIRSGVLTGLRARIERNRSRPWLAALAVLPVALVMDTVLSLPWGAYSGWWREKAYGMTSQPFGEWLGEWALNGVINVIGLGLLFTAIYWLLRRAPKTWWLWASGVTATMLITFMLIAPMYILPLFNTYTPAPEGPVRDAVVEMAKANGVPSDKIFVFDGSKQSNRYTANVTGLFGSAQVNMSDTMFKAGADMSEIRAVVGHEMGHYAQKHILWTVGILAVLATAVFWLVGRLFPVASRLLGAKDVTGIADPAGLPVFFALIGVIALLLTPVTNSLVRIEETDADNFSLRIANEPDGIAKALIQTVEYRAATPSQIEEIIFYDHPSVSRRIRNAMEWKAKHPPAVPATPAAPAAPGPVAPAEGG
jgi:STE24 endopeptidase